MTDTNTGASNPHARWHACVAQATQQGHAGDLLRLAAEAPTPALAETARAAARRISEQQATDAPRQVLLFSGHLVDAPGRAVPRFPPDKVPAAAQRIAQVLAAIGAGTGDVAYSQAAAGGDLLFVEACLARGVCCEVLLPFDETEFIARSIAPISNAAQWLARYGAAKAALTRPVRCMPAALGPTPDEVNPFERCNLWLLDNALVHGGRRLHFICLWNGGGGDGPGGTQHMHDEVQRRGGRVWWIDTRTL